MKLSNFIVLFVINVFLFLPVDVKAVKAVKGTDCNNLTSVTLSKYLAVTDTLVAGKVIEHVRCKSDPGQSYAIYIPVKAQHSTLPVVYFFDPHGDGALPLKRYRALADKHNFILVGSNNSKNGNDWSTTENIWRVLSGDSQKRLKIKANQVYVCGFSGGAKVAGYIALHHTEVKAVIANGAGLPDESRAGNFNFSFTAIAGEGDMNMTDLVAFNSDLDKTRTRHRIIYFYGVHEWAPAGTMDIAFVGVRLDALYEKLIPRNDGVVNNYIKESKKQVNGYVSANNLVKAEQECKLSINMLNGLTTDVSWFREKDTSMINNITYQKQWQAQQHLLITEQNLKAGYMQQFQQGDINYWTRTIKDLQSKAMIQDAEGAMYKRLQAYLSLAFYSLSNRFITSNYNSEAQHFINLYKLADPQNSEAWYLSAIINARNDKTGAVEEDLQKAVKLGFTDKNRMMQQPDFKKLGSQINFSKIKNTMN